MLCERRRLWRLRRPGERDRDLERDLDRERDRERERDRDLDLRVLDLGDLERDLERERERERLDFLTGDAVTTLCSLTVVLLLGLRAGLL